MEFDGNDRDDDDDDDFGEDRDIDEDEDDERDRDDFSSSIDSDFSRDSKEILDQSFFNKRDMLPNTMILTQEMGCYEDESNNPLNEENDRDPDAFGS